MSDSNSFSSVENSDFDINRDVIFELAQNNPIVHIYVTYYELGNLSWEDAMMCTVRFLVKQNENMFNELKKGMHKIR